MLTQQPALVLPDLQQNFMRMQARSLLTAHEDFTTLQFHAGTEIQRPGFVFSALKQRLDDAKVEEIKRICLTVDQKSAIFDVPSGYVKVRTFLISSHQGFGTSYMFALMVCGTTPPVMGEKRIGVGNVVSE